MNLGAQRLDRIRSDEDDGQVLQDFLDEEGDPNYVDSLIHLCEMGGCPDEDRDPEYRVKRTVREGSTCRAVVDVFFDEKTYGGGCDDIPSISQIFGELEIHIDLQTGDIAWFVSDLLSNSN